MNIATADIMDIAEPGLQSCTLQLRQLGGIRTFWGPIRTVRTVEDNALVRHLLGTPGAGAVLVVDGAGSLQTALLGDVLATLAHTNGWKGVIIHGAVRDIATLSGVPIGIKALGSNPRKSAKLGAGTADVPVEFGDVIFRPGEWLYADDDGIVVSPRRLHP